MKWQILTKAPVLEPLAMEDLTIGDKLDKLKELYTVEIFKDGRVDPNNCAYVFKHSMEYNFIVFEVKSGIIEHIKIYN